MLAGSVVASDAFFPFPDGPEAAIDAGATAVIQPGGSKRDDEVIAACDDGRGGDGLHRPPPLPPLMAARGGELDVLRVFCAADGSGGNPLGVFLDGATVPEDRAPGDRRRPRLRRDGVRRRSRARPSCGSSPRRSSCRSPATRSSARRGCCASAASSRRCCARRPARCRCASTASSTCVAGKPEWGPPFEFVEVGSPAEVDALDGAAGRLRPGRRLGLDRRGRGADPRAGLRRRRPGSPRTRRPARPRCASAPSSAARSRSARGRAR